LVDTANEIEEKFGVVLDPPEQEHITIATGEVRYISHCGG